MKPFKVKRGRETYFRVDLPQQLCPDGRRRSVMGKTKADALEKAKSEMDRAERGLDRDAGEKTTSEFLDEFLAYYKRDGGIAPSTFQDYCYHVQSHITPILGKVKLRELDPRKVDEFMRALHEKGLAARTAHYSYSVLRRALQFAVDWKYIPVNPASSRMRAAKRRQVKELSNIRFLNREESCHFLDAVRGDRHEALYVLAITTGMRQGEMLGLQWPDVDLAAGKITISRSLHRTKRRRDTENPEAWFTFRQPKTTGSRRTLDIPPVTVSALQGRRRQQDEQRLLAGESWTEQKLIFTTRLGTPVDTSNILHRFQQILKEAGIEKMRFYDLRHTHASLLIAEGVHPKKIAERLGHASIKLTMDLYGHLFDGSDKESADRMQKLFGGDRPAIKNTALDDVIALPALRKRA
jgi:integrase